jgi:hypothetical protein
MNCDSLTFRAGFASHRREVDLRSFSGVVREVPKNLFHIVDVEWRLKITKVDIVVDEQ